jgi:hypothetical protein
VQREALDVRLRCVVPFRLVPAAADDPLTGLGLFGRARHLLHDVVPRARLPQVEPHAKLPDAREMPVAFDEARNGELALEPDDLRVRADELCGIARLPMATILSPRIAMARATGIAGFMVTILPLLSTRSAGWA